MIIRVFLRLMSIFQSNGMLQHPVEVICGSK